MVVDFTKFPYPRIVLPDAATLTEAIANDPVASGFVIITAKATEPASFLPIVRDAARALRTNASESGLVDITAYRQLHRDELGGAIPFDQPICDAIIDRAIDRASTGELAAQAAASVLANPRANCVLLFEYRTPELAIAAVRALVGGADDRLGPLVAATTMHAIGAFKNMRGYATVSRDPNVVHFFNLFGAPGELDLLWRSWQEALPWFFEIAEFRSSFPLLALDPSQPILLVNYAHCDSTKHFVNGALTDPVFMDVMRTCYVERQVTLPTPFFCKIVPV